jgi:hypothetical protein
LILAFQEQYRKNTAATIAKIIRCLCGIKSYCPNQEEYVVEFSTIKFFQEALCILMAKQWWHTFRIKIKSKLFPSKSNFSPAT